MRGTPVNFASYRSDIVELKKGINENVSSLELEAGELIDCKNYMLAEGGYGGYISIAGYERMDGIITPSKFVSKVLTLENAENQVLDGETITGGVTGATGIAVGDATLISGDFGLGTATQEVQMLIDNGIDFVPPEACSTVSGDVGDLKIVQTITGGTYDYHNVLELVRTLVDPVPGEGPILGIHIYKDEVYAFRKKVGVDEVGMYREDSITGWTEVDTSGDPIEYSLTATTMNFVNYNFYAGTDDYSMFWVDGYNQARMYNRATDTVTVIDNTGMSSQGLDSPLYISAHNYHLFLGYRGGSLQFSALGEPLIWDGEVGASEIGLGDDITGLISGVQSSLIIFLDSGIRILQGNSVDDFVLDVFSEESGAFIDTPQRLLGTVFFIDDRGLTTLEAVDTFGDYAANSISQRFKQTLLKKDHNITVATVSRDLNQYRVYFDDRQAIYVSFEGKEFKGATFIEFNKTVDVVSHGEIRGEDVILFASLEDPDGYVFKMDSGRSFDGTAMTCRLSTAFYHYGSPRNNKMFRRCTLETSSESGQHFDIKVDFDYNELGGLKTIWYSPTIYTPEGGAIYGESKWGIMVYGTSLAVTNRSPIYLQGIGTNMSYKIISNETYRAQHIIQNIITDYELVNRRV